MAPPPNASCVQGIGQGQTIELLASPAVLALVRSEMTKADGEARSGDRTDLADIAGWLHINSIHSETLQFSLLSEQKVRNVWRKAAFNELCRRREEVGSSKEDEELRKAVAVFRDRVDMDVQSEVLKPVASAARIAALVEDHKQFINSPEQQAVVDKVKREMAEADASAGSEADAVSRANESQNEQSFEQEQEQEQVTARHHLQYAL